MRPTASLSRNGMIAAIAILVLAVVACIAVGFKFSDYLVSTDDEPETEVLQQQVDTTATTEGGGELPPKTTLPIPSSTTEKEDDESTTKKPNQITEFVSKPETTTSIFDVEENQIPNTTRPQQQRPTTTKPTTTKPTTTKEPETEKPTEEETTKRPGFIVDSMG